MYVGIRDITDTVKNEGRSLEMSDLQRHTAMLSFPPVGKRFVLLIESDPAERSRLSAILFRQYHVLHAVDEASALTILQTEYRSISLIFYSVSEQLFKGGNLLRTLQQDHLLHTIPVFVLSDNADPQAEYNCLMYGASDYIRKTVNSKLLLARAENLIRLHESDATLQAVEFDSLTGLYTREAFYHHAVNLLCQYPDRNFALIVTDINGFKEINRRRGVAAANQLLTDVANYFSRLNSKGALLGRL